MATADCERTRVDKRADHLRPMRLPLGQCVRRLKAEFSSLEREPNKAVLYSAVDQLWAEYQEHLKHGKMTGKQKEQIKLSETALSQRTINTLEERGIFTVGELLQWKRSSLLSLRNFGEVALDEVLEMVRGLGF